LLWTWLLTPSLQPSPRQISGAISQSTACFVVCESVVQVADLKLSCGFDVLGLPSPCPSRTLLSGTAQATYAPLPTLSGLLGRSATSGVLLELRTDQKVVYRRSVRSHVVASVYQGWGFHAVYWPLVGLIIWRWPNSRFSRRVQWASSR
jgi:hypothetical protein